MRRTHEYTIDKIAPYINWDYFYHAWGLTGKTGDAAADERRRLRDDAERMLRQAGRKYRARATFHVGRAASEGDDILLATTGATLRLPMLRQQRPDADGLYHSLADYVSPRYQRTADRVGVFAATVDESLVADAPADVYTHMMAQTLADRLAEAAAEKMHAQVRRYYWGYARREALTIADMVAGRYQGIRPAVGYPAMPDMSLLFLISDLLDMPAIGIRLTESGMMTPHASVAGLIIANPGAHYFDVGPIGEDQLQDYARRRGLPEDVVRRFLQAHLQ